MKGIFKTIPLMLLAAAFIVACDEVEEESAYDNWQLRNEQFADSLATAAGDRYVVDEETAAAVQPGELFFIANQSASTSAGKEYIYCKKLVANPTGERPNYEGWHSTVSAYYYGTLITGDNFDGNFDGYSLEETRDLPAIPFDRAPSEFDLPNDFSVTGVITGWTWALQFMREGERWMLYIPYNSAYGTSGSGTIPGYSALVFDLVLDEVK